MSRVLAVTMAELIPCTCVLAIVDVVVARNRQQNFGEAPLALEPSARHDEHSFAAVDDRDPRSRQSCHGVRTRLEWNQNDQHLALVAVFSGHGDVVIQQLFERRRSRIKKRLQPATLMSCFVACWTRRWTLVGCWVRPAGSIFRPELTDNSKHLKMNQETKKRETRYPDQRKRTGSASVFKENLSHNPTVHTQTKSEK